jgi:hypothetical protein
MIRHGTLDWDLLMEYARPAAARANPKRNGTPHPHIAAAAVRAIWEGLNRGKGTPSGLLLGPDELMRVVLAIGLLEHLCGQQPLMPTHRTEVSGPPDYVPRVTSEVFPTARLSGRWSCKYCYRTHRDWWQMPPEQYGGEDVILCGKCEHTSVKD